MPAKIISCTCKHASQDMLHGEGKRVYVQTMQNDKKTYRCTVCLKEKTMGESETKGKK